MHPRVSVIFPVHQREAFLQDAIDSVLSQTMPDFELLIIDDGAGPRVGKLLDDQTDPRIRLIRLPVNLGVSAARNAGLKAARAPYIALMDSDDVALPERLATQVAWLDEHPEVTVCGSNGVMVLPDGQRLPMRYPGTDAIIKARMLLVDSAVMNASVMMRTDFLRRHRMSYDSNFTIDEDHALFMAMMQSGATFASLDQALIHYRRHAENVTNDGSRMEVGKAAVRARLLPLFFPELTGAEGQLLLKLMRLRFNVSLREAGSIIGVADKAMRENRSFYGEDRTHINRILERQLGILLEALRGAKRP